ncbi:integrase catalytic domain-containing protein [Trichonephila clavipes]|nr:integrase catalytic domain-containing protein [Trichonephila clavipes]
MSNCFGIKKEKIKTPVSGLNGLSQSIKWKKKLKTIISNEDSSFAEPVDFLIVDKITEFTPSSSLDISNVEIPKFLTLADKSFYEANEIHALISADIFFKVLKPNMYKINEELFFKESEFGWIACGKLEERQINKQGQCFLVNNDSIQDTLKLFFDLEGLEIRDDPVLLERDQALEIFKETVEFEKGRYIVQLPFRKSYNELSDNYPLAKQRFQNLWRRFGHDSELYQQYREIIRDYTEQGIIEEVKTEITDKLKRPVYYLPHQAIKKDGRLTSKTRIVLDAGSHQNNELSLNYCLWPGINLNPNLLDILIKFRLNAIAFCSDIKQAFLQICLADEYKDAVRFLWSDDEPCVHKRPKLQKKENFNVHPVHETVSLGANGTKVLGLSWNTNEDYLTTDTKSLLEFVSLDKNTKRFILQAVGKIFDPLGLISPFTVRMKCLLQDLWKEEIQWDDPLPTHIEKEWKKWCEELPHLRNLKIPRLVLDSTLLEDDGNKTRWKQFVANLVNEITSLTDPHSWYHCAGKENPADFLSPGLSADCLVSNSRWWTGAEFLSDSEFPKNFQQVVPEFNYNCRNKSKKVGPLTVAEFKESEIKLIKHAQRSLFDKKEIPSSISNLFPFVDEEGIVRVGGRLENASVPYLHKHPAILPKGSKLSKLYFNSLHTRLFHVGPQGLLNAVRQKIWPLSGRSIARKTVHQCVTCFKSRPILSSQIMGNLPSERVNISSPFTIAGLDLCGPFLVKYKNQRKGTLNKVYICVCICFSMKAIHLELLSDLTSDALIATLKRFTSRRGKCSKIYTDNATNFVGANSILKKFHKLINFPDENLAKYFVSENIDWKFIPPKSPHFGGLWEAGIKSVKHHLKRAIGNLHFTFEEFETIMIQVEGILNSRPLTPSVATQITSMF